MTSMGYSNCWLCYGCFL